MHECLICHNPTKSVGELGLPCPKVGCHFKDDGIYTLKLNDGRAMFARIVINGTGTWHEVEAFVRSKEDGKMYNLKTGKAE